MPSKPILEFADFPQEVVYDIEQIRARIPQRFEMEQLTALTLMDLEQGLIVGYKDVAEDAFWARGHMPGFPIMPGVLMLEAAAQLGSVWCHDIGISTDKIVIGLGGMDDVRFRGLVRPGDRLWIVGKTNRWSHRATQFSFQGWVNGKMVFEANLLGIPLQVDSNLASTDG